MESESDVSITWAFPMMDTLTSEVENFENRDHWRSIRVVGELKSNPDRSDDHETLIQLANYVRELFSAQPSRGWVHCFTLCGQDLRAWLFDRSGAISSDIIDINADPKSFIRIVCG
jgi:hypothetical protein